MRKNLEQNQDTTTTTGNGRTVEPKERKSWARRLTMNDLGGRNSFGLGETRSTPLPKSGLERQKSKAEKSE